MPTSTAAVPDRAQAMAALQIANHVRTINARMLEDLHEMPQKQGLLFAASLLLGGDMKGPAGAIQVYRLVTAIRYIGDTRAEQILCSVGLAQPTRAIRRLSIRQRNMLAWRLETIASAAGMRRR